MWVRQCVLLLALLSVPSLASVGAAQQKQRTGTNTDQLAAASEPRELLVPASRFDSAGDASTVHSHATDALKRQLLQCTIDICEFDGCEFKLTSVDPSDWLSCRQNTTKLACALSSNPDYAPLCTTVVRAADGKRCECAPGWMGVKCQTLPSPPPACPLTPTEPYGPSPRAPGGILSPPPNGASPPAPSTDTLPPPPPALTRDGCWQQVSVGYTHTCAIKLYNRLACWGDTRYGQGQVSSNAQYDVRSVSAGFRFNCGISLDGYAGCSGDNSTGIYNVPADLVKVVSLVISPYHACALDELGKVACWGANEKNQSQVPTDLPRARQISTGDFHTCALLQATGTVRCWGDNQTANQLAVPSDLTGATVILAGGFHTCALRSDSTVVCWGSANPSRVPPGLTGVVSLSSGLGHTCALKADTTVVCWGDNTSGQIDVPANLTGVVSLSSGLTHICAITNITNSLVCWGNNMQGQASPPANLSNVKFVSAGPSHTCALTFDGNLRCFGDDTYGQLVIPFCNDRPRPIG